MGINFFFFLFFLWESESRAERNRDLARFSAHRDMCRTVPSIRAKEKAESGRKGTVWDHAFSWDDHCCIDETVDLGQRWGPPTLPVSRGCKPQPSFLRFGVASWKARYCTTQDGKGDPIWLTGDSEEETAQNKPPHCSPAAWPAYRSRIRMPSF